jgi:hypothetical protein
MIFLHFHPFGFAQAQPAFAVAVRELYRSA